MTPECDQNVEELAEILVTKWMAIRDRLRARGLLPDEIKEYMRVYILGSSIDLFPVEDADD